MNRQAKKIKSAIIDFAIYTAGLTVINYLVDYRSYGDLFERRLVMSLRHAMLISAVIVFFSALLRWAIKWKIMMTLKRISPGDMETCRDILASNRWTKLTREEKNTISAIIDKTAFKYSSSV